MLSTATNTMHLFGRIFFTAWFVLIVVWNVMMARSVRRSALHGEPGYAGAVTFFFFCVASAVACTVLAVLVAVGAMS